MLLPVAFSGNALLTANQTTQAGASTNPAAERIRENQRRSRARRKEFVEGMQRRLDDYEKQGVEATLQMQQAARTVAIENSRLRLLLGRRGVTGDEIDKFLAMFETGIASDDDFGHGTSTSTSTSLQGFPPAPTPAQQAQTPSQSHYTHTAPDTTTASTTPTAATPTTYQHHNQYQGDGGIDRLAVLADASIGGTTGVRTPSESTVAAQSPPSAGPATMPGTPVSHGHYHSHGHGHGHGHHHHHHHTTPQAPQGSGSPLVMSCNTAAQIIAEMQGGAQVNKHSVKASLGCADNECECFVKNTLLFQLMERNAA